MKQQIGQITVLQMLVCTIACCYLVFATSHWQSMVLRILARFTAFSLPGQFPPRSELANSTMTNLQPGTFDPGSEMARELATDKTYSYIYAPQKFQGTKWPGSERTRERIGPGPIGRFAPGSKLARERKGSAPLVLLEVDYSTLEVSYLGSNLARSWQ